jgi:amino acid permease
MGWNYVFQWAIVLPFELVVASLTVGYWNADINIAVWISTFLLTIIAINVFGVLGFAEEEFWAAIIKLSAIVIFMVIGLVLGELRGRYSRILLNFCSSWWWTRKRHLQRILGGKTLVRSRRIQERIQGRLLRLCHCRFCLLWDRTCWPRRC